jgi:hypothetical protein
MRAADTTHSLYDVKTTYPEYLYPQDRTQLIKWAKRPKDPKGNFLQPREIHTEHPRPSETRSGAARSSTTAPSTVWGSASTPPRTEAIPSPPISGMSSSARAGSSVSPSHMSRRRHVHRVLGRHGHRHQGRRRAHKAVKNGEAEERDIVRAANIAHYSRHVGLSITKTAARRRLECFGYVEPTPEAAKSTNTDARTPDCTATFYTNARADRDALRVQRYTHH